MTGLLIALALVSEVPVEGPGWATAFPRSSVSSHFPDASKGVGVIAAGPPGAVLADATQALVAALKASGTTVQDVLLVGADTADDAAIAKQLTMLPVSFVAIVRHFPGAEGDVGTTLVTVAQGGSLRPPVAASPSAPLARYRAEAGASERALEAVNPPEPPKPAAAPSPGPTPSGGVIIGRSESRSSVSPRAIVFWTGTGALLLGTVLSLVALKDIDADPGLPTLFWAGLGTMAAGSVVMAIAPALPRYAALEYEPPAIAGSDEPSLGVSLVPLEDGAFLGVVGQF